MNRFIFFITKNLRNHWNGSNNIKRTYFMNFMDFFPQYFSFFHVLENPREKYQFVLNNSQICYQEIIRKDLNFISCRDLVQIFSWIKQEQWNYDDKTWQIKNLECYPRKNKCHVSCWTIQFCQRELYQDLENEFTFTSHCLWSHQLNIWRILQYFMENVKSI